MANIKFKQTKFLNEIFISLPKYEGTLSKPLI